MPSTTARLQFALDKVLGVALAGLLAGTAIGFGGASWWSPAAIAAMTTLLVVAWLIRSALSGSWKVLQSPLTALGLLAVGLAVFQIAPIRSKIAELASPRTREVQTLGLLPALARTDDPDATLPEALSGRTPLTVDRPATLRWIGGAAACLALFWVVSHYADRLGRLYLVWGCVVGAFLLNTSIVAVQLVGQADGLFGFIEPGNGPRWGPTTADAQGGPGRPTLRPIVTAKPTPHDWALAEPERTPMLGTMLGGPGATLALGAIGLPLALAMTLQLMAPRGSREPLWTRLADTGQGSLLVLLYAATIASGAVVGLNAGRSLSIPFAAAVLVVGLPTLVGTGLRWKGIGLTALVLAALAGGVALGDHWEDLFPRSGQPPRVDFAASRGVWSDALPMLRDFPILGTGLGSFASIQPYYKTRDAASTTAMSSLLQWWVESGSVGLALLGAAGLWALVRLPGAIGRVGSADRALAAGLAGAVACFATVSTISWTIQLPAVALAASAVAGTFNRWLAGGTDLFVDRG